MAVSQVSTGDTEEWSNASGARNLTKDSGTAAGDFAIAAHSCFEVGSNSMSLANFTTPGEISFPGSNTGQLFHRAIDGGEGASFAYTASAAIFGTAALMTMRGNGALTFNLAQLGTGASGTTCTAPSVSGTAGQVLVVVMLTSDPTTMTTPTGMTAGTVGLQNTGTLRMFWEVLSATGGTGTRASTLGTSRDNIAYSILLDDAGAGGSEDIAAAGSVSITGAAALNAAGSLLAAGAVSITGAADLDARGALVAAGAVSISGAADLDARGVLVAAGALSIAGAADLDAIGQLLAAGALSISGAAAISGTANDIVAAGSVTITGAAALSAIGQLAAAGSIVINGAASLDQPAGETPAVETFSGGFYFAFERERARRRKERREREEREEEAQRIEEETTRQIALLLREQEAKDARRAELARLSDLVSRYAGRSNQSELNERVQKAVQKAATKRTVWALYALERELQRAHEEEQFLLDALRLALDG